METYLQSIRRLQDLLTGYAFKLDSSLTPECWRVRSGGGFVGTFPDNLVSTDVDTLVDTVLATFADRFLDIIQRPVCSSLARTAGIKKPPDMAASVPLLTNQPARVVRKNLLVRSRCTHS
jgi:hypothetical protein